VCRDSKNYQFGDRAVGSCAGAECEPIMKPTEHAIWLIESRLRENPRLDDIAAETGFSRYYLSRLFAEQTGKSFASYVRGRRLSEAAKELLSGAPDILSVAIGAGYGSHEAFTRAFSDHFSMTPEEMRKRGAEQPIRFMEPLRMKAAPTMSIDPPAIETLPTGTYVGLARTYEVSQLGGIPDQWAEFQRHLAGLDPDRVGAAYGIVRNAAPNGEDVEYVCAIPAGRGLNAESGLIEFSLPEMTVAKFAHKGHIAGIKATTGAIFEQALPAAGLKPVGPVDLIEVYGRDFDPRSGFGTVGLWVHVED
jgi:AraC family transcriptional regulator